jgi:hypothetical protein
MFEHCPGMDDLFNGSPLFIKVGIRLPTNQITPPPFPDLLDSIKLVGEQQ